MRIVSVVLLISIFICGCSPQLRALISLSSEQDAQKKNVESQTKKFSLLLADIKQDKLKPGINSKRVINIYDEPIAVKEIEGKKRFLYREPKDFFPNQKIYLFFDENDVLIDSELVTKEPSNNPPKN